MITPITLMELYVGCAVYEKRQKMFTLIEEFMSVVDMVNFDIQTCKIYGDIYSFLRSKGKISEQQT
jgi:predicted nucleic acid-binding protein